MTFTVDPHELALARRVEEAGLNALQTQQQLFYDGWVLRLSPGKAKRARSVSAHFESTLPLARKIDHCEAVYARRGLPMLFRVTPFARPAELAATLQSRGYVPFDDTLVQVAHLHAPPEGVPPEDATVRTVGPIEFADAVAALRSSSAAQRDAHVERLSATPLLARYVVVKRGDDLVAAAQMAGEGEYAGVFDVMTAPAARGRGYASAAVARLLAWSWEHAMTTVYLQVTASNAPAVAIYRKFGFRTLYSYHYLARPDEVE